MTNLPQVPKLPYISGKHYLKMTRKRKSGSQYYKNAKLYCVSL